MSPERETAISYLSLQLRKYREELRTWLARPPHLRGGMVQSRIIGPLRGLIEDGTQLLARLRSRPTPANDHAPERHQQPAARRRKG